jgi:hypothetical protein
MIKGEEKPEPFNLEALKAQAQQSKSQGSTFKITGDAPPLASDKQPMPPVSGHSDEELLKNIGMQQPEAKSWFPAIDFSKMFHDAFSWLHWPSFKPAGSATEDGHVMQAPALGVIPPPVSSSTADTGAQLPAAEKEVADELARDSASIGAAASAIAGSPLDMKVVPPAGTTATGATPAPSTKETTTSLTSQGFKVVPKAPMRKYQLVALTPKLAPLVPEPQLPPDDDYSKRMKYLLEHGSASLEGKECFMFSEETGEGALFLNDGTVVRRQIAFPKSIEDVQRTRRHDMFVANMQYNLSLLGKLFMPGRHESKESPKMTETHVLSQPASQKDAPPAPAAQPARQEDKQASVPPQSWLQEQLDLLSPHPQRQTKQVDQPSAQPDQLRSTQTGALTPKVQEPSIDRATQPSLSDQQQGMQRIRELKVLQEQQKAQEEQRQKALKEQEHLQQLRILQQRLQEQKAMEEQQRLQTAQTRAEQQRQKALEDQQRLQTQSAMQEQERLRRQELRLRMQQQKAQEDQQRKIQEEQQRVANEQQRLQLQRAQDEQKRIQRQQEAQELLRQEQEKQLRDQKRIQRREQQQQKFQQLQDQLMQQLLGQP